MNILKTFGRRLLVTLIVFAMTVTSFSFPSMTAYGETAHSQNVPDNINDPENQYSDPMLMAMINNGKAEANLSPDLLSDIDKQDR